MIAYSVKRAARKVISPWRWPCGCSPGLPVMLYIFGGYVEYYVVECQTCGATWMGA
jgi:hypothetical protein